MTAATKNQFVNVFRVHEEQRGSAGKTLTFRTTLAAAVVAVTIAAAVAVAIAVVVEIAVAYFPILLENETKRNATQRGAAHGKAAKRPHWQLRCPFCN